MTAGRPLAVVGLGRMGMAVAQRLMDAGHEVHGHDTAPDAQTRAAASGVHVHDDCAGAVAGAAIVITFLPSASVTEAVAPGLLDSAGNGTIWLEMSSSDPALTRILAERAAAQGVDLLDAPVAGGVAGAENGTLTIMAAGPAHLLSRARPVLDVLGTRIIHVSERPGDGDAAKAINNLLAAANLALATEGVLLGLAEGLDVEVLLEILNASSGGSFATRVQLPTFMLTGGYDARFTVAQYAKDLGVALEMARRQGLRLHMSARARELWDALAREGHDGDDYTRIAPILAGATGLRWPTPRAPTPTEAQADGSGT